ncbi:MAG: BamA/TamA family outer membrane protein, partial [Moraxellaceae bacterium]|nr:BamA/TamA family outer membrane protein [Moraxellaceae bacterium]
DNSLGPRSPAIALIPPICIISPTNPCVDPDPEVVGGNVLVEGSAELVIPTPFAGNNRQLRTVLFVDAGNVYDTRLPGFDLDLGVLRYSAGISLSWLTAIGPLSFSLSRPFNEQAGDKSQTFQFTIGQGL